MIVIYLVVHLSNVSSLWPTSLLLFRFSMLVPLFNMIVWHCCLSLLCYSSLYGILFLVGTSLIVVFVGSYVILIRLLLILWLFLIWLFFSNIVIIFDCFFFLGWFISLLVHLWLSICLLLFLWLFLFDGSSFLLSVLIWLLFSLRWYVGSYLNKKLGHLIW